MAAHSAGGVRLCKLYDLLHNVLQGRHLEQRSASFQGVSMPAGESWCSHWGEEQQYLGIGGVVQS